jgi:acetyltransferase-like isoleucine patch superfamily enzyme
VSWISNLKRRALNRLRFELAQDQRRRMGESADLHPHAVIEPEGSIENLSGDRSKIFVGAKSYIRGRLLTYANGGSISIGSWSYVGIRSEIWSMNSISIGNRVLIAHDVNIFDNSGHSKNAAERHEHYRRIIESGPPRTWAELPGVTSSPVVIEDDVWISFGVTILQGVRIGARSVIAAGSTVTRDVAPDTFYRNRFEAITGTIG